MLNLLHSYMLHSYTHFLYGPPSVAREISPLRPQVLDAFTSFAWGEALNGSRRACLPGARPGLIPLRARLAPTLARPMDAHP